MKNYRGWKLTFADGVYTATKKGRVPLRAESRVAIDRRIDAREWIDFRDEFTAGIKKMNAFIKRLESFSERDVVCHNFAFTFDSNGLPIVRHA